MTPEEEDKLTHDALRDLGSGYENVRLALGDGTLAPQTRAVLESACVQLGWSAGHLSEVLA